MSPFAALTLTLKEVPAPFIRFSTCKVDSAHVYSGCQPCHLDRHQQDGGASGDLDRR